VRIAVISDIHGNRQAFEAALDAIAASDCEEVWCLGDLVGYGADPDACVELARQHAALCLAGNHDLVVIGTIAIDDFSGEAAAAARWTQTVLGEQARAFLEPLEPAATRPDVELFHGSPRDPVWDYVLSEQVAWWSLRATEAPVVLVGHSHVALALRDLGDDGVAGGLAPAATEVDLSGGRWLLNPGSVGQPRDGDPRAAWLLLDLDVQRATFRRVEYDIAATQAEMRSAALPDALASRLAQGE
jgi:predicted phosphodiesterase